MSPEQVLTRSAGECKRIQRPWQGNSEAGNTHIMTWENHLEEPN